MQSAQKCAKNQDVPKKGHHRTPKITASLTHQATFVLHETPQKIHNEPISQAPLPKRDSVPLILRFAEPLFQFHREQDNHKSHKAQMISIVCCLPYYIEECSRRSPHFLRSTTKRYRKRRRENLRGSSKHHTERCFNFSTSMLRHCVAAILPSSK